jgi:hypothetical protein
MLLLAAMRKFVPLITTTDPAGPLDGEKELMTGTCAEAYAPVSKLHSHITRNAQHAIFTNAHRSRIGHRKRPMKIWDLADTLATSGLRLKAINLLLAPAI